jgi:coenzyme F420-0:L-glutamate ligase/coenzyme F420-1:gamma-L-glutamate ligase
VLRAFRHPNASEGTMICEHRLGLISANAAVDESNTGGADEVILLPQDPDASAQRSAMRCSAALACALALSSPTRSGDPGGLAR